MILATERLTLRMMTHADLPDLAAIMQDPRVMVAYEGPFDDAEVRGWLERTLERYEHDGFALWAVQIAGEGPMIGQCGVTIQQVEDERVIEVGYLFAHDWWHRGYAAEAARGCRDWAFEHVLTDGTPTDAVHSIVRDTNVASMNVAIRNGMTVRRRFVKHYRGVEMPHLDFAIGRAEWAARRVDASHRGENNHVLPHTPS